MGINRLLFQSSGFFFLPRSPIGTSRYIHFLLLVSSGGPSALNSYGPLALNTDGPSFLNTDDPSSLHINGPSAFNTDYPPAFSTDGLSALNTDHPPALNIYGPPVFTTDGHYALNTSFPPSDDKVGEATERACQGSQTAWRVRFIFRQLLLLIIEYLHYVSCCCVHGLRFDICLDYTFSSEHIDGNISRDAESVWIISDVTNSSSVAPSVKKQRLRLQYM